MFNFLVLHSFRIISSIFLHPHLCIHLHFSFSFFHSHSSFILSSILSSILSFILSHSFIHPFPFFCSFSRSYCSLCPSIRLSSSLQVARDHEELLGSSRGFHRRQVSLSSRMRLPLVGQKMKDMKQMLKKQELATSSMCGQFPDSQ